MAPHRVRPLRVLPLLFVAALLLAGLSVDRRPLPRGVPAPPVHEEDRAGRMLPPSATPVSADERAQDRAAWELQRLRDPATGRIPPGIHRREQEFAATLPRRRTGYGIGGGRIRDKTMDWNQRGPRNYGGRTRALAVDVADPTHATLLAGGVSGGMWRSEDRGLTWTPTTGSSQLHSVTCVLQDTRPGHRNVWWYGTGEVISGSASQGGDAYYGDGIYRSDDGGRSWYALPATVSGTPQSADQPFDGVYSLVQDTTNVAEPELYAATMMGIYRSVDGGWAWTGVLGHTWKQSQYTEVAVGPRGTVWAALGSDGTERGFYRSADGLTWTRDVPPGLDSEYHRVAIAAAPAVPGLVFFLTSDREDGHRHQLWMHFYPVAGGTEPLWYDHSATLDALPDPWGEAGNTWSLNTQRGYNLHVTVDPANPATVYVGGVNLWRSTELFSNSLSVRRVGGYYYPADDEHHADQHRLVFVPGSSGEAYTATDGGVHRTADIRARQVVWENLNHGYDTTQFYTVAVDREAPGDPVIVGGAQDHGTLWSGSATADDPWRLVLGGDGSHCAVIDAAAGRYVLSTYFGWTFRVQLAADGAVEDVLQINPTYLADRDCLFINPFVIPPADEGAIYLASRRGVWRNLTYARPVGEGAWNRDEGWERLTEVPAFRYITALAVGGGPDYDLYYGSDRGLVYRVTHAATGTDREPEQLGAGTLPLGAAVSAIAVHPADSRRVLVAYGNYHVRSLWSTVDGGKTWTDVEANLGGADGPSIRCLAILADGDRDLWLCGTSIGLFSSLGGPDGRTVWVQEGPEALGNVIVDALAVRPADRLVVAATHGRGIFSTTVPTDWWQDRPSVDAPALANVQAAPNPFNGGTAIAYELSLPGPVTVEVWDLRGRRVATVFQGTQGIGSHSAAWNGRDAEGRAVASGVYLYRVTAAGSVQEGKVTCLR